MTGRPRTTSAAILEALKEHAKDGIGVEQLAEIAGCSTKVVKQAVCRLRLGGEVIGSRRINERAVRYFYGDEQKLKTWHKPKPQREKIYDALVKAGDAGLSGAEVKAICTSVHAAKNACEELKHAGRMVGCRWVGADSWRYFLTAEAMQKAYAEARAAFVPFRSKRGVKEPSQAVRKTATPKPHQYLKLAAPKVAKPKRVGPQGEAINPRGVKPIQCRPTMAGERWADLRPEPVFSRLGIGRYVE